jgi:hypothetical protein
MQKFPTTPALFRRQAEAAFRRANPEAEVAIEWTHSSRVTWADGSSGFSAVGTATASGYKPKTIVASANRADGISVR